ncbi:MAG: glycosyltransferase [Candidatus Omnitrophica bacterium]|nr:glycosyltransferase [Candidatus Omnitrophota bacterium]
MPKLVSIVIPAYNCGEFIAETLESVLNQTYPRFEIIVVDDGSTDSTEGIVRGYVEKHPEKVVYYRQENGGAAKTRNVGLSHAKGEYIAFLDGDDIFFPEKLEKTIAFLEQYHNYALVYTDMFLIDDEGHFLKHWLESKKYFDQGHIFINLLKECFFIPSSVVIRKEILDQVGGFDENIRYTEDADLWLRIAKHHQIGLIKEPLVKWRIHQGNTSKDIKSGTENMIKVFEKQFFSSDINAEAKKILRKRLAEKYFDLGYHGYRISDYRWAKDLFLKSFLFRPYWKTGVYGVISFFFFCFAKVQSKEIYYGKGVGQ